MKKCIILFGVILCNLAFGQDVKAIESFADNFNNQVKFINIGMEKDNHIIGSAYISEEYVDVNVEGIGQVAEKLRYNSLTDHMEFLKDNQVYNLTDLPNKSISFKLGYGPIYKFIIHNFNDGAKQGYTQILVDGDKFKLLKRQVKYLKNSSKNSQTNQRDTSFEIDNKPAEYILESNGKYYKFPKNSKALANTLRSKNTPEYKLLEKYNFNSEKDLIELVNEINK